MSELDSNAYLCLYLNTNNCVFVFKLKIIKGCVLYLIFGLYLKSICIYNQIHLNVPMKGKNVGLKSYNRHDKHTACRMVTLLAKRLVCSSTLNWLTRIESSWRAVDSVWRALCVVCCRSLSRSRRREQDAALLSVRPGRQHRHAHGVDGARYCRRDTRVVVSVPLCPCVSAGGH